MKYLSLLATLFIFCPAFSQWTRVQQFPISVNEAPFDITNAHDTLFLAGKTGIFYMSMDNGLTWRVL